MKQIIIRILLSFIPCSSFAQAFLTWPVEGEMNKDYLIVNYVDWAAEGIRDHQCLSKTYDGHQGTDFTLRSFPEMDSGHYVLAAASGRVTFIQDGLFDREKESVISKGLGNYIAIRHPNKYFTYYGHLKSGSLLVKEGDSVQAGQRIAMIGSSGNSTDPHLHFELWYDSLFVVDPFRGNCGNQASLWINEEPYDSGFYVHEHGLLKEVPTLNELREREHPKSCCPYAYQRSEEEPLVLWAQLSGLRKGDVLTIEWHSPENNLWFDFNFNINRDWWYYYFWSYIENGPALPLGEWKVLLKRNDTEILSNDFILKAPLSLETQLKTESCPELTQILQTNNWHNEWRCFDMYGKEILLRETGTLSDLKAGLYVISGTQTNGKGHCTYKWFKPAD